MQIEHLVIGGERVLAAEGKTFAVIEPGSGKPFAEVAEARTEDVERAMQASPFEMRAVKWHLSPRCLSTGEEQRTRFSAKPFRYRIPGLK